MRFALLILWLLPVTLQASEPDPCPGRFAELTQLYRRGFQGLAGTQHSTAAEIKRTIQSGYGVKARDGHSPLQAWERWEEAHVGDRELLSRLPSLNSHERQDILDLVHRTPATTESGKRFRRLVLLGLYDRPAWSGLLTSLVDANGTAQVASSYLPALVGKMPVSLKEEFLGALGARYRDLPKERALPKFPTSLSPKRLADLYFKQMMGGDQLIKAEIQKGRSPRQAFEAYVNKVHSYMPAGDLYSADQTIEAMKRVQASLQRKAMRGFKGPEGEEPFLLVGGSLVNGRANLASSDMDVITNFRFPDMYKDDLERAAQDYVLKLSPQSDFHLEYQLGYKPDFWNQLHPVVFRVRPNALEMLVYDPQGRFTVYPLD